MGDSVLKLKLILWKNFKIRLRHYVLTLCEIFIPILLFIGLTYLQTQVDIPLEQLIQKAYISNVTTYEIDYSYNWENNGRNVYYAPINNFTKSLMTDVQQKLNISVTEAENEKVIQDIFINNYNYTWDVLAVIYENITNDENPHHLSYRIRSSFGNRYWQSHAGFYSKEDQIRGHSRSAYLHSDFSTVQRAIDSSFIEKFVNNSNVTKIGIQKFPTPPELNDTFKIIYTFFLPLITTWSFMLLSPGVLKRIMEEKSSGIKELMKMSGMKPWMLWFGWFLHGFAVNIISVVINVMLLKGAFSQYAIIPYMNSLILFVFVLLYCIATICFIFAQSTLFSKPKPAVGYCLFILQLTFCIPLFFDDFPKRSKLYVLQHLFLLLFPNVSMFLGYNIISPRELEEIGVQWNNLFQKVDESYIACFGSVLITFLFQIVFYSFFTFYVDNIYPGQYGVAKKWKFIFGKTINNYFKSQLTEDTMDMLITDAKLGMEAVPESLVPGIKIRNLKKSFGNVNAVNGLNMDIYKDQITILLGHNGAGKTTTMHILTGMISATSGSITIGGYDIEDDIDKIRKSLGLCTQHNLLFTDLTLKEHLIFFAMLRGETQNRSDRLAKEYLQKVLLLDKENKYPDELSGGMKRKLSLGIALVGNPKVLLLDEPTSGLDPEARRQIWNLLLSLRENRTMLITTHFLEEADILGDRIAIMDHGNLLCYGTSIFLKKQFGTGYHLTLTKNVTQFLNENSDQNVGNQVTIITDLVKNIIPDAVEKELKGNCLSYMLPVNTTHEFPKLFEELENNQRALGISSIAISITTLDDVFLRVGSLVTSDSEDEETNFGGKPIHKCTETQTRTFTEDSQLRSGENTNRYDTFAEEQAVRNNQGIKLCLQQLNALIRKRLIIVKRSKAQALLQYGIPILFVLMTILFGRREFTINLSEESHLFNLTFKDYYENTNVLYSYDKEIEEIGSIYKKLVTDQKGNAAESSDISNEFNNFALKKKDLYINNYAVAAEFFYHNNSIIGNAMYSTFAIHSLPISINLVSNSILQYPNANKSDLYTISVRNHPFPKSKNEIESDKIFVSDYILIYWLVFFSIAPMYFIVFFVTFPLNERVAKIKQLQLMTGVNPFIYWMACFICDFFLYLLFVAITIIIVAIFDTTNVFSNSNALGVLTIILITYGLSFIPFTYLFSYKSTVTGAQNLLMILNYFIGLICVPIVIARSYLITESGFHWTDIIKYLGFSVPHFSFTYCCMMYVKTAFKNFMWIDKEFYCTYNTDPCCEGNTTRCDTSFFDSDSHYSMKPFIISLLVTSIVYFSILIIFDTTFGFKLFQWMESLYIPMFQKKLDVLDDVYEDSDVVTEENTVKTKLTEDQDNDSKFLAWKLKKKYKNIEAVKSVSFSVNSGECFGLLGVNGAGKSTTFKMLTYDIVRTNGNAAIDSTPIDERVKYLSKVGYCPQIDALNGLLTAIELMNVFANLRGIPQKNIEKEVTSLADQLGLAEYMNHLCKTYSGGNKRKLSIAIALIADCDVILLDEPTSGVDPVSRRKLWDIILNLKNRRRASAFILTSHSMEECEILCDRLTIMVDGKLKCIGNISYLKQKFQQGFTLQLKLKGDVGSHLILELKKHIHENFIAFIKDEHKGLIHYHINPMQRGTSQKWTWSQLFKKLENIKSTHPDVIEDYCLGDTTLEEIFLSFARENKNEVTE